MAWRCHGATNAELIHNMFRAGLIKDTRIRDAMLAVSHPSPEHTMSPHTVPLPNQTAT